jgi:putative colanic acid biosynthesis acetyltransferase WcaF
MTSEQPTLIDTSRELCPSVHSFRNKLGRVVWSIVCTLLFRPSPRLCLGWRRFLLRCFGAKIGKGAKIMSSARIWAPWNLTVEEQGTIGEDVDCYNVAPIVVGAHATVSQHAHLCAATHDITHPNMLLTSAPIVIGNAAWICAGAFVRYGVTVGEGAVCGARAVVVKDVPDWTIVAGHPAREIKKREIAN